MKNRFLLNTGRRPLQEEITIGVGNPLGVLTANIVLLWHHVLLSQSD